MPLLPSKLFPGCEYSETSDAGFYDIAPAGYAEPVGLYLGAGTTASAAAVQKAAAFFDNIAEWDAFGRGYFANADPASADGAEIDEYFRFFIDEAPDAFGENDPAALSRAARVAKLKLVAMASHGAGQDQHFTVDFSLGYDQLLSLYYNADMEFDHMAWES